MPSRDHLLDLLVARATEGLSAGEPGQVDGAVAEELELAAAAVYLAFDAADTEAEPMPDGVRRRILAGLPPAE